MKIIVTGGCGFIGGHLVDSLVGRGHSVTVIDDLSSFSNGQTPHFVNGVNYNHSSICSPRLFELFDGFDHVFHLAALARIQESIVDPVKTCNINVSGTANVLDACVRGGVKGITYSSTSAVYGLTDQLPTNELTQIDCLNPYAASKFGGEQLVKCYSRLHGLKSYILRYFNVYGERSQVNGPYSLVIGLFLDQFRNSLPLTVVGNGKSMRDFIHVSDVVRANVLTLQKASVSTPIVNIGSGTNYRIIDVASMISSNIQFVPERKGEALSTLCDVSLANKLLGWQPVVDLESWLLTAVNKINASR